MEAIFFKGNHKIDPGWYRDGVGPFFSAGEADAYVEGHLEDADLPVRKKSAFKPILSEKRLVRFERSSRNLALRLAIWTGVPFIIWFGGYQLLKWSLT